MKEKNKNNNNMSKSKDSQIRERPMTKRSSKKMSELKKSRNRSKKKHINYFNDDSFLLELENECNHVDDDNLSS